MTRYEKIMAMSAEELAKYWNKLTEDCGCQFYINDCPEGGCEVCWHEWLTEEAADG